MILRPVVQQQVKSAPPVNLSSIYGLVGAPDVPPYHASKGAVTLMSKTDALLEPLRVLLTEAPGEPGRHLR